MGGSDDYFQSSIVGVLKTVSYKSVDHFISTAKTAINVVSMEIADIDSFVEDGEFFV